MLDIKYIREQADEVKENIKRRGVSVDLDAFLRLDEERLNALQRVEALRRERNEVAEKMKHAKPEERAHLIEQGKGLKDQVTHAEEVFAQFESEWKSLYLQIPNRTHPQVATGATDADNKEIKIVGEVPTLSFSPKNHVELAAQHDLIDFERGAKVAGAKFYFLKGKLAMLEQALIAWAMKEMVAEGFTPMITPDLAKDEVLLGAGFNPRGPEAQIYSIENQDLSLIGTAEIPLGGYHMNEVINEDQLPLKYVGLSHCFRTEAGTYGRESYGLYRVHQFSKVELFVFAAPWQSDAIHEELRHIEEMIYTKLGLVFHVVDICTGDLGGPAYRKYDLEAWMWGVKSQSDHAPGGKGKAVPRDGEAILRGGWGEVTSASNCTDYQARRLNIKMRKKDGSLEYLHTLNGTAVALSRAPLAILEQCQQADGSILIPEVLQPFCGFDRIG